jgi:hypothetical protein
MESNELKKNAASEELDVLQNNQTDEAATPGETIKSADIENEPSAPEPISLTPDLPEPASDSDLSEVPVSEVLEIPEIVQETKDVIEQTPEVAPEKDEAEVKVKKPRKTQTQIHPEPVPLPLIEASGTPETVLIDHIVQVVAEADDDDDDLFSDHEPDAHSIPIHDYSSYSKVQLINIV